MRTIKLAQPYINQDSIERVVRVLESGWLTQGPVVAEFEEEFKKYLKGPYALAVSSATAGLHMALLSLGIGPGDEVIVPSFTWVATANAVELCGAKPVLADIDLGVLNATPVQLLSKISPRTKAIIPVHLFGKPFNVQELKSKLPRPIFILEDAACAAGAMIQGQYCGTFGDIGVYSFHPRKSITTGEGGLIVTYDKDWYDKMSMLRNHGQDMNPKSNTPSFMYDCPIVGFNYRMADFQAALGLGQLKQIDEFIDFRNILSSLYMKNLSGVPECACPSVNQDEKHSWQAFVITLTDSSKRDQVMEDLKTHGIETRPGTHAVHLLKYYRDKYAFRENDFPIALQAFNSSISLPLHNHMSKDDVDYVSEKLKGVLSAYK
jgi:perosamine synthetase